MFQGLFLDTAGDKGIAFIFSEKEIVASFCFPSTDDLFLILDKTLKEADVLPTDLDFIAAGRGPGSFTGIRKAQMAARALAYALNLPLYGLSSLHLYGGQGPLLMDARSGGFWAQVPGEEPVLISHEQLGAFTQVFPLLFSPHPEKIESKLRESGYLGRIEKGDFDLKWIVAELLKERNREGASHPDILYLR
jgi:tRNA threonylcarbamoyl adenosine modification protein YeaZ